MTPSTARVGCGRIVKKWHEAAAEPSDSAATYHFPRPSSGTKSHGHVEAFPLDEAKPLPSDEFPIDMELVKVLASDSRRDILRLLQRRRMTLSEMSAALDLKKATVLEHLKKLTEAGLIRRIDDERLWVYYELTHRGGRLVNPGRTRFFLVLAWAAAAAVVLAGAAALAFTFADAGPDGVADTTATSGMLKLELGDAYGGLAAGAPVTLRATLQTDDGPVAPARALLLSSPDGDASEGVLLEAAATDGASVEFRSESPVPAGDYYLYVADTQGRDNAGNLTPVRVPAYVAVGPQVLWRGISDAPRFQLLRDGAPVTGTIILWGPEEDVNRTVEPVPAPNGTATLDLSRLDALRVGTYAMQALTDHAFEPFPLASRVVVREPLALVTPLDLVAGQPAALTVTLGIGDGAPDEADVRLDGQPIAATSVAPGVLSFALDASQPGERNLTIGRLVARQVTVHASLEVGLRPLGDGTHELTSAPNVTFTWDGAGLATTNESGGAVVTLDEGEHVLAASDGPAPLFRSHLFVHGWEVSPIPVAYNVVAESSSATHEELQIHARVAQENGDASTAILTATIDGIAFASERVPPGADAVLLRLRAPPVGEHRIALRAEATPPAHTVRFENGTTVGVSNATTSADALGDAASAPAASGSSAPQSESSRFYLYDADYRATSKAYDTQLSIVVPPAPPAFAPTPMPTTTPAAASEHGAAPAVPGPGLAFVVLALALVAAVARRKR